MKTGKEDTDMEFLRLTNTMKVLQEYAVEFRNMYQDNLIRSDRIASGELLNSIEAQVTVNGTAYEVQLRLADYWKYVEEDTRPHRPPLAPILEWVRVKPVLPRPDAYGRIPTPESLAYLISRKIAQSGTEGSHDLRKTQQVMNADIRQRLEEAFALDVSESFSRLIRLEFSVNTLKR